MAVYRLGQRRSSDIGGSQLRHRAVGVRIDHQRAKVAAHRPGRGDLLPEPGLELAIRGQFPARLVDASSAAFVPQPLCRTGSGLSGRCRFGFEGYRCGYDTSSGCWLTVSPAGARPRSGTSLKNSASTKKRRHTIA
jgi:hypothetical protein